MADLTANRRIALKPAIRPRNAPGIEILGDVAGRLAACVLAGAHRSLRR